MTLMSGPSRPRRATALPSTSVRSPTPATSRRGFGCGRPTGGTLGDTWNVAAAVIDDAVAPVTGTYLVLVASADSGVGRLWHLSPDDDPHAGADHRDARRSGGATHHWGHADRRDPQGGRRCLVLHGDGGRSHYRQYR